MSLVDCLALSQQTGLCTFCGKLLQYLPSTCFWPTLNPFKERDFFMTSVLYASESSVHVSLALFLISHKISY
jgi:hypothetical protein